MDGQYRLSVNQFIFLKPVFKNDGMDIKKSFELLKNKSKRAYIVHIIDLNQNQRLQIRKKLAAFYQDIYDFTKLI